MAFSSTWVFVSKFLFEQGSKTGKINSPPLFVELVTRNVVFKVDGSIGAVEQVCDWSVEGVPAWDSDIVINCDFHVERYWVGWKVRGKSKYESEFCRSQYVWALLPGRYLLTTVSHWMLLSLVRSVCMSSPRSGTSSWLHSSKAW